MTRNQHRSVFVPVFVALLTLAWLTLWAWSRSPYGRYLEHGDWLNPGQGALLCQAVPGGNVLVPAVVHAGGWLLMISAMMLPTTLPLLEQFRRMTRERGDANQLMLLIVAGYVGAWAGFGLIAHAVDGGLLEALRQYPALTVHGWILGVVVIAGAGLFQFSALKYRCLEKCRTPLSFIMSHWGSDRPALRALRLGFGHGVFCVGCCWALMLLMFVVGTGSIGWMLVLGAIMAIEKNMPWGRRISAPLGIVLLGIAVGMAAKQLAGNLG